MGGTAATEQIMNASTAIDCQKQVRTWRLVRSCMELLIPSCGCYYPREHCQKEERDDSKTTPHISKNVNFPTIVTGTIFGFRHGKVSLCIQPNSRLTTPIILLGLAVPTTLLAREMKSGLLRIALDCNAGNGNGRNQSLPLMSMPVWTVYCNGRKAGFAVKRNLTKRDMEMLRLMKSVVVGAGTVSRELLSCEDDELIYLRANFQRVSGFSNSESFHLIDPDGATGQELSIFFLGS
ncbi:protein MIZU-KUSSEI 1-like [Aristolochia californica]|uniref:protein MIZU-KUSSEI 1-like n=1 Tax=Aristolochia californica TaxID=171875 RepID=UPI0035E2F905